MALSATGVKITEAGDISPCLSQVSEGLGTLFCPPASPSGCGSNPTFSQGGPPTIQDKAAHRPPLSLNSLAQAPSSITGKRQTCDIEGTLGMMVARDQKGWGPLRVGGLREP